MILSIDCSTQLGSVALVKESVLRGYQSSFKPKAHSELLNSMIAEAMAQASVKWSDLTGIATTIGPGSFTGLRVSLNAAKTLSYSLGVPLFIDSTLQLLARQNSGKTKLVAINAFKSMVFIQAFKSENPILDIKALNLPESVLYFKSLGDSVDLIGEGFIAYPQLLGDCLDLGGVRKDFFEDYPNAYQLGLAAEKKKISTLDWKFAIPLYIKASEAEEVMKSKQTNALK